MIRQSIAAFGTLAMCIAGAVLLATFDPTPAPAAAQPAESCPGTLPHDSSRLTCQCAAIDGTSPVWGSDFYTDDSNLCNAAVHAGAIPASGGTVSVVTYAGRESYQGVERNGIVSRAYGRWSRTIGFVGGGSFSTPSLCPGSYNAKGTTWYGSCRCPSAGGGTVWGSGPYTADSNLCLAARHAGAIGSDGGMVSVAPAAGQDSYAASTRNGVTTSNWGSYDASFTVRAADEPAAQPLREFAVQWGQSVERAGLSSYLDDPNDAPIIAVCGPAGETDKPSPGVDFDTRFLPLSTYGVVFGGTRYPQQSNICLAAIHRGAITWAGGRAKLEFAGYVTDPIPGSFRNGVYSHDVVDGAAGATFRISIP